MRYGGSVLVMMGLALALASVCASAEDDDDRPPLGAPRKSGAPVGHALDQRSSGTRAGERDEDVGDDDAEEDGAHEGGPSREELEPADLRKRAEDEENALVTLEIEGKIDAAAIRTHPGDTRYGADVAAEIEPLLAFRPTDWLSFVAHVKLEEWPEPDPNDVRIVEDHALFLEELYAQLSHDEAELRLGKLNPVFGRAFDETPGIWGEDFAEDDYELTELVGAALGLEGLPGLAGSGRFDAALVRADRSVLSDSLLYDRGRTHRRVGGAGNTEYPTSLVLSFTDEITTKGDDDKRPAFRWNTGLRLRPNGRDGSRDEVGGVLGAEGTKALGNGRALFWLAEGAYLTNAEGSRNDRATLTAGVEYDWGRWLATAAAAFRLNDPDEGSRDHDKLVQLTIGYRLAKNVTLQGGWRLGDEDGERSHALGLRLAFEFERGW